MLNKIKNALINLVKKHKFLRRIARSLSLCLRRAYFNLLTAGCKTDSKTVVFACFQGLSYCDSPKAIYEYMQSDEAFREYSFIWAFKEPEKYSFLSADDRTTVIKIGSGEFSRALAMAKYWVLNYKIQDHIFPKKDQVFLQCWHGTPLKRLGCDIINFGNAMNTVSEIRSRYNTDTKKLSYFISPSAFASKKFISAWNMKALGKESIILEEGYPRNDLLKNYNEEDILRIRTSLGIENGKKIILYAPTYRDNQHSAKCGYTYKTEIDFNRLREHFGDEYIILFRPHWLVARNFDFEHYSGFIYDVSDWDDISELYIVSDILITDYSSVFFDYANLKRPIIFYMYDLDAYRDDIRGFYLDIKELPGNIVTDEDSLIEEIAQTKNFVFDRKYEKFCNTYNYLDDGNATQRVVEKVFRS